MKKPLSLLLVALPVLVTAVSVKAHDPSEHMAAGEAPDCAALHQSDGAKMDMNDPVAQAMMKKCMNALHGGEQAADASHGAMTDAAAGDEEGDHQHDNNQESTP